MVDYNEESFRALCRAGAVAIEIEQLDEKRRDAVKTFWLRLALTILAALAVIVLLAAMKLGGMGFVIGLILFFIGLFIAMAPLSAAGSGLKEAALATLAKDGGLTYMAGGFDPPVYPDARPALFGSWLKSQSFTDLFHGVDEEGRRFAIYEGNLTRKSGKNTVTVFSGQMYAWQRRGGSGREIVIVPDRGIFNFFKPLSGMERVRFEGDPDFERRFEVYAYEPHAAMMVVNGELRRALLELRQAGRVFGYINATDAFVAATGVNRFEAGSMFKSTGGTARVRAMFDDVCTALAVLKRLRSALGG